MGRDKALLPVAGIPMAMRVAAALQVGGCEPVLAVGGDSEGLARCGLPTIVDRWPGEGPLGGVITALRHFESYDIVMVVACDLLQISAATVVKLVGALSEAVGADVGADVAMAITDRQQPLCAAWRPGAAARLSATFASGGRRLLDALAYLHVINVDVDAQQLINVNTVDDLPG